MRNFFAKLIPFILLGVALVAFAFGLMLLMYLLIFGAIVGLVLFIVAWIRERFFLSKEKEIVKREQKPPRTYDHKD